MQRDPRQEKDAKSLETRAQRVLITGAGGFIGRHLVDRLDSHNLTQVHHRESPSADIVADIGPETDWSGALDDVDVVIHLAARVHKEADKAGLELYRQVNRDGTTRLAHAAAEAGVKRFIFMSTAGIVGPNTKSPIDEAGPFRPVTPYAISKREAEEALLNLPADMDVVILRPPLVYGPNAPGSFTRLCRFIERGVPLPLGRANELRSLIYVRNLVDVVAHCVVEQVSGAFFVADGRDVSPKELAMLIGHHMDGVARLFSFPPRIARPLGKLVGRSADVDRLFTAFRVDSSRLTRELDWEPPFTIDEALKDTVRLLHDARLGAVA